MLKELLTSIAMTKYKLMALLCANTLLATETGPAVLTWFYTTTDRQLLTDIENARQWQHTARVWGEHDMEVFWRGVEYHAQLQYNDLWRRLVP